MTRIGVILGSTRPGAEASRSLAENGRLLVTAGKDDIAGQPGVSAGASPDGKGKS